MNTSLYKVPKHKNESAVREASSVHASNKTVSFVDNRPEAVAQKRMQDAVNNSPQVKQFKSLQALVKVQPAMQMRGSTDLGNSESAKTIQRVLIDLKHGKGNTSKWLGLQRLARFQTLRPAARMALGDGAHTYVVLENGDMNVASGNVFHGALSGGEDVNYAGTLFISKGVVVWWSNWSGHYMPPENLNTQAGLPLEKFISRKLLTGDGLSLLKAEHEDTLIDLEDGSDIYNTKSGKKGACPCVIL